MLINRNERDEVQEWEREMASKTRQSGLLIVHEFSHSLILSLARIEILSLTRNFFGRRLGQVQSRPR